MEQTIRTKYINPSLNIGLVNWRELWDLSNEYPEKFLAEVYKGKLVFRLRGSSARISYQRIKKGLVKKEIVLKIQPLPF